MTTILSLAAALCFALMIAFGLRLLLSVRSKAANIVLDYADRQSNNRQERIGAAVIRRTPMISWETWRQHLRWAQRGGKMQGLTLPGLVFQSLLFGAAGVLLFLFNPSVGAFLVILGGMAYPFVRLRSAANSVRKRIFRTLPEVAALIAAELAAGSAPDLALHRAAMLPGPLSVLLNEALETSRQTGRPLFSRKPLTGSLVETLRAASVPALAAFASQLDLVASKGVAGASLMSEIARSLGQEYKARLQSEVEKLDSRLVMVVAIFFFVPFVVLLLYAAISPVLAVFG